MNVIYRLLFKLVFLLLMPWQALMIRLARKRHAARAATNGAAAGSANGAARLGFVNIEFFHEEAGGFGGYGQCAKNVTDHYNLNGGPLTVDMIIARSNQTPALKRLHNTDVLITPDPEASSLVPCLRYGRMLRQRRVDLLMTMEFYPAYLHTLLLLPTTPVLVWIHDPRPVSEMEKIATVELEMRATGSTDLETFKRHAQYKEDAMRRLLALSRPYGRRVLFAATAHSLAPLAADTYGLAGMEADILPTPVEMPLMDAGITYAERPSVGFLGRMDPIKRPWMFCELARRFPSVDFYVAGKTHFPELMRPVMRPYEDLPNLKFLGHVSGPEKDAFLRNMWVLVNTSVHEALPVSFLETFSYGKPMVSCQNPDRMAERFGAYTGELLGHGGDARTIDAFAAPLDALLRDEARRRDIGQRARQFVELRYSFDAFDQALAAIFRQVGRPVASGGRVRRDAATSGSRLRRE